MQRHELEQQQRMVAKRAEGAALRAQLEQERAVVEVRACPRSRQGPAACTDLGCLSQAARQRKLAQLAAEGVPAKFTAELARYKPFKAQP